MKDDDYLESKYRKIISKLLVEHPYYGAILSSMKVHESEDAYRIFPNGNNIMVNREWFTNAAPEECKFELSKVAVKISLLQESRMKNRLPLIWNLAMESVSESILHQYALSRGVAINAFSNLADGLSVDEFYIRIVRALRDSGNLKFLDVVEKKLLNSDHLGESEVSPLKDVMNAADIKRKDISWFQDRYRDIAKSEYLYRPKYSGKLMAARRADSSMGKRGVPVEKEINGYYAYPSWVYVLCSRLEMNRKMQTFKRIKRKYQDQGIILPSYRDSNSRVNIAIDSSASIDEDSFSIFSLAVIDVLAGNFGMEAIRIFQTDAGIRNVITIDGRDIPSSVLVRKGEGGTDFRDLFRHLEDEENRDPLIVLTDGKATIPEMEPDEFRTYWITTEKELPWGDNIKWDLSRERIPSELIEPGATE